MQTLPIVDDHSCKNCESWSGRIGELVQDNGFCAHTRLGTGNGYSCDKYEFRVSVEQKSCGQCEHWRSGASDMGECGLADEFIKNRPGVPAAVSLHSHRMANAAGDKCPTFSRKAEPLTDTALAHKMLNDGGGFAETFNVLAIHFSALGYHETAQACKACANEFPI